MRAHWLVLVLATGCTPDIAPGSYLCGPNASCPEGQVCNGPDNLCVFEGGSLPFECQPDQVTEPDDDADHGRVLAFDSCVTPSTAHANCLLDNDAADWARFTAPSVCAAVQVEARVSFPIAFERVGLELWNLDTNTMLGTDGECTSTGAAGEDIRCLTVTLTPGGNYGIKVKPTGEGNCDGACAHNRYTLRVQLSTPG